MVSRGQQTVVMGSDSCLRPSLLLRFSHVCTRGSGEGITPTQSPAFPLCSAVTPFHCCFHPLHLFISLLSLFWCNFQISPHLCVIFLPFLSKLTPSAWTGSETLSSIVLSIRPTGVPEDGHPSVCPCGLTHCVAASHCEKHQAVSPRISSPAHTPSVADCRVSIVQIRTHS